MSSFITKRNRPIDPPPPPEAEAEDLDFISRLPDCVLSSILSLLPLKDSARTSVLSSRWRHLWRAATLRLDDSSFLTYLPRYPCTAVFFIFKYHHGPVDSLRLSRFTHPVYYPSVDRFVESAIQRGIRELTLEFHKNHPSYQLLPSLLHSESLHHLSLKFCRFPKPALRPIFPNLKELRLNSVELSNDLFQNLQSSCSYLETLHLFSCCGLPPVVTVSSLRLREFVCKSPTEKLIIEDAPNLESLMLGEDMTSCCEVMVLHAPKLELLGFLCMKFGALQLGETFFKQQPPMLTIDAKATPCGMRTLSTVKTLAINMECFSNSNLDRILPSLLRCFPCLENLDFVNYCNRWSIWDEQDSFSFLDHLKTVTIKGFSGCQIEVDFLSYLVVHGTELKKITLLSPNYIIQKFVETKTPRIWMDKRASSDLKLFFFDDTHSKHFSMWNELIGKIQC